MRSPTTAVAVGVAAALLPATPALAAPAYRPEPVEFELKAPHEHLGTSAASGFVSEEIRSPQRFNLVGFIWEGDATPGIAVRVRKSGEEWSRWTPIPPQADGGPDLQQGEARTEGASQPVWAGEADYLQYRVSRRPPGLRLHFINTTGTATPLDRVETALRGFANDAVTEVASPTRADVEPAAPKMIYRRAWGADACQPRQEPQYRRVKLAFVHHTVSASRYSRSEAKSMVLGICRYHRDTNGWNDIGYNFLVDRFGRIFVGRAGGVGEPVVGAHAEGFNSYSTGVAALGTHTSDPLSGAGVEGIARLLRWKLAHHGAPATGGTTVTSAGGSTSRYPAGHRVRLKRISGHRDVGSTECPGDELYDQLRAIRRAADAR
jgi:hypothetical protein